MICRTLSVVESVISLIQLRSPSEIYKFSVQLNLRHIIKKDILIYPGYVPEPGINYRVFHYGLKFTVGNWSFDKADWRETDIVNTCWAKFPEPPDPSTISNLDENTLQRDLLSIECGKALNKALQLHHEKRRCPPPHSITNVNQALAAEKTESDTWTNNGDDDQLHSSRKILVPIDVYNSSTHRSSKEQKPMRVWMLGLWAFAVLGFLAIVSMILSSRREEAARIKSGRRKKDKGRS